VKAVHEAPPPELCKCEAEASSNIVFLPFDVYHVFNGRIATDGE